MEIIQDYVTTLYNIEMATLKRHQQNDRERQLQEFRDAQVVTTKVTTKDTISATARGETDGDTPTGGSGLAY